MSENIPPCIICSKEIKSVLNRPRFALNVNQPGDATAFLTRGHYGSTVWDPMNPDAAECLEVNFCDKCLSQKIVDGAVRYSYDGEIKPIPKGVVSNAMKRVVEPN